MLVTIARTERAADAHILRGRLEAEGIPAFVEHDHPVGAVLMATRAMNYVKLRVPVEHTRAAAELLQAVVDGELQLDDADPDGYAVTKYLRAPDCPRCGLPGEADTRSETSPQRWCPWPLRRQHWRCTACGDSWATRAPFPLRPIDVLLYLFVALLLFVFGFQLLLRLGDLIQALR